ncbi:Zinc finger SWIM-type [Trinorchestia longiramus]|nr:Zinc finger SWIM-type [Trinorchestia longiramus]
MEWVEAAEELVREAGRQWLSAGQLSQDILCCLHSVYGKTLMPALQLIDDRKVTKVTCPSGRWVYRVSGSSGVPYICLPGSAYCQCPAYKYSVLLKREAIMCKHVLAAKLATQMVEFEVKAVSDLEMVDIFVGMD